VRPSRFYSCAAPGRACASHAVGFLPLGKAKRLKQQQYGGNILLINRFLAELPFPNGACAMQQKP
jgi:hypothetical protein